MCLVAYKTTDFNAGESMNQTYIEIQKAVQAALHHHDFDHQISDPKAFYVMAMENGLSGLIFSVLDERKTHPELYRRLKRNHYDYVSRDVKQLKAIHEINDLLNQEKINHLFMKGSVLKYIYPETYMRAMGDIDILIHEEELIHVHEIFKKVNIICKSRSKQHDVFEMTNGIIIEIHPILYKDFNDDYELIKEVWKYVHLEQDYLYRMNPEFELIYLIYHLAKHIEAGGIGLRSILDISLYLQHYESRMNFSLFDSMINTMNLKQFFYTMIDVSCRYFGFTYHHVLCEKKLNDLIFERFIEYLMVSGIHGIGRDYNIMQARATSYAKKKKSKFRLILDTIFPNYETMLGMYPWLKRMVILYPVTWILRWIRIVVNRPKASMKKVKQLGIQQKEIDRHVHLLKSIGL